MKYIAGTQSIHELTPNQKNHRHHEALAATTKWLADNARFCLASKRFTVCRMHTHTTGTTLDIYISYHRQGGDAQAECSVDVELPWHMLQAASEKLTTHTDSLPDLEDYVGLELTRKLRIRKSKILWKLTKAAAERNNARLKRNTEEQRLVAEFRAKAEASNA